MEKMRNEDMNRTLLEDKDRRGIWRVLGIALLIFSFSLFFILPMQAQADSTVSTGIKMRDAFISMPDSLLPTLSHNSRLDLIDFFESGMSAEVENLLEGKACLTALAADSLSLRMSGALTVDMRVMPIQGEPVDSCRYVLCMIEHFGTAPTEQETQVSLFSAVWRKLGSWSLSNYAKDALNELIKLMAVK